MVGSKIPNFEILVGIFYLKIVAVVFDSNYTKIPRYFECVLGYIKNYNESKNNQYIVENLYQNATKIFGKNKFFGKSWFKILWKLVLFGKCLIFIF